MGRRVPGPVPGAERPFVPAVPGEPVRLVLRTPTEGRKRLYIRASIGDVEIDETGRKAARQTPEDEMDARRALLRDCVVSIADYVGADGKPIETGEQLHEHGESEIVNAVVDELMRRASLTEEEKKTSAASSASAPTSTAPSPGTAASASGSSSTSNEAADQAAAPPPGR